MNVYTIYTNTGNHEARASLLSDTVITKMPVIACFADSHKTHSVRFFRETESNVHPILKTYLVEKGAHCIRAYTNIP